MSDLLTTPPTALAGSVLPSLHFSSSTPSSPSSCTNISETNLNSAGAAISKIEDIFESIADCILDNKKHMSIELKTRKRVGNHVHDEITGTIQNGPNEKMTPVKFPSRNPQEAWKFAVLLRILELVHEALATGVVTTKRDMYYRDPELFMRQAVVDRYVDDLAYTLGVERDALNVVAAAKGLIAGAFSATRKDGSIVDYRSEPEGILIPNVKEISSINFPHAKWIIVIEKEATFRTLATKQYHKHSRAGPGIILTAKGYPDISTRQLLHLLFSLRQHVPIYALVDFDPDGIGILSTYKYGSLSLAHENAKLAVPSIQWLGVKSSDFTSRDARKVGLLKLSARDRRIATRMLEKECFEEGGREEEWRREVQVMLMLGVKAEIQILRGLEDWLDEELEASKL